MKNKLVKVLGIVLAVAILVGLLIPAMPVSAGTLSWTAATMPSTKGFQLVENMDANLYAVAPDGKTIFAYGAAQADSVYALTLYKSVDGGITWTDKNIGENLNDMAVDMLLVPKDYATERTIYAVVGSEIWRSRNSGASFAMWADAADTGLLGPIVSIDEAEYFRYSGNIAVLVAAADGIALYNDYDAGWELITDAAADGLVGTAFIAAAFSPNYRNDAEILAVTTDGTDTYLETMFGLPANKTWNQRVNKGVFLDQGDTPFASATRAIFAFPSDYNYSSNNRVFVAFGGAALDIFRANGSTTIRTTDTKATDLDLSDDESIDANIYSMAYKGTYANGTLVVSIDGEKTMFYTKEANTSTPDWVEVDAPPTGINIALAFGGDTMFAGSASDAGFGGMFASSTDYNLFTGMSLISFPSLAGVSISKYLPTQNAPNQWVVLADATYQVFFKSTDAGKTWREIFTYEKAGKQINVNQINFTADAMYTVETGPAAPWMYTLFDDLSYRKSTDGGYTWENNSPTIDGVMSSFALGGPDIWIGSTTGGVYKDGSYDQVADLDGKVPWVMIAIPGFFMIYTLADGGPGPGPSDLYVSTDNGATFDLLGDEDQFRGLFQFAFVPPAKTIYTANKANDGGDTIYKWVVGTSTSWEEIVTLDLPAGVTITGLTLAGDGTLYVAAKNEIDQHQIYRCVSFTDKSKTDDFQIVDKTSAADFMGPINAGPLTVVGAAGVNTLYPIIGATGATPMNVEDSTLGIASDIMAFGDTLAAPIVATAPVANSQVETAFTAKWNAVESPKSLEYEWQIATDDKFQGIVDEDVTSALSAYIQGLVPGTQYYFRARVATPLFSAWSTTAPFTAKLASTINDDLAGAMGTRIAPAAGATGVPLTPSFQWSAVRGAQSYKIQVADNPGFTSPLADASTTDPFYTMTTALQPGKTYYWRIQAIAGTNVSDWVSNVFTTATPPAAQPTATAPPIVVPTPIVTVAPPNVTVTAPPATGAEAPGTPAYIWVIIAIGAVLVIAVIVLIARTRRSV